MDNAVIVFPLNQASLADKFIMVVLAEFPPVEQSSLLTDLAFGRPVGLLLLTILGYHGDK